MKTKYKTTKRPVRVKRNGHNPQKGNRWRNPPKAVKR